MSEKDVKVNNLSWEYVDSNKKLDRVKQLLAAGTGPIGIDVERASGYKYSQRAYLIQIYRENAGTFLIDPLQFETLKPLSETIKDQEWVLHAAHSDLESLANEGLIPEKIYDTELASRLLGMQRVGLGSISQELLNEPLEKAYSRADWSQRPLPEPWLEYAALDVIYLPRLQAATKELLEKDQKLSFAYEEFEALLAEPFKEPPAEPWRKIPGHGKLRTTQAKNIAKELWLARENFAQKNDLAPTLVLPNKSIITAALMNPRSPAQLTKEKDFHGKYSRKEFDRWWHAIKKAKIRTLPRELSEEEHSSATLSLPPNNIKIWEKKNPEAYERFIAAKELLRAEAERLNIPPENVLSPKILKTLSWFPPQNLDTDSVSESLKNHGARSWQRNITSQIIVDSFVDLL